MDVTPPWRKPTPDHLPGVPAWGAPTSHAPLSDFPLGVLGEVSREWAWAGSAGRGVRVCIVDSGVDASHPEIGPVETAMTVEDDQDGEPCIVPAKPFDDAGHGTACASIVRGIAPEASISSMRVLTESITGSGNALVAGLNWAVEAGFDVVNLSLSTTRPQFSRVLYEIADRAYFRRCVLVVSAHNMPVQSYPWPYASVISVASHDETDPMLHYYNPAPPVEFYARGVAVPIAWKNHSRIRGTGNSYAAPHISGLCALILAKHPSLTPFQLKSVLFLTARNVTKKLEAQDADA